MAYGYATSDYYGGYPVSATNKPPAQTATPNAGTSYGGNVGGIASSFSPNGGNAASMFGGGTRIGAPQVSQTQTPGSVWSETGGGWTQPGSNSGAMLSTSTTNNNNYGMSSPYTQGPFQDAIKQIGFNPSIGPGVDPFIANERRLSSNAPLTMWGAGNGALQSIFANRSIGGTPVSSASNSQSPLLAVPQSYPAVRGGTLQQINNSMTRTASAPLGRQQNYYRSPVYRPQVMSGYGRGSGYGYAPNSYTRGTY